MAWRENISTNARHIVCLSGGKDSSALAIYLRNKIPNIEYVFCDTKVELQETYEYLDKLETFLERKITYLSYNNGYGFEELLRIKGDFLPAPNARWCTECLKIKPFNDYIGDDKVFSYVGIRADESGRKGFIPTKDTITTVFPFIEDDLVREDILHILEETGLGLPEYYKWRSRSGCFFCFYQKKIEWIGLFEHHPDLYWRAASYEKFNEETGKAYTWIQGESLKDLIRPERIAQIKEEDKRRKEREQKRVFFPNQKLVDLWGFRSSR